MRSLIGLVAAVGVVVQAVVLADGGDLAELVNGHRAAA
jgi:flagellar motor component MotA